MVESSSQTPDEIVGHAVRRLREARDWSQRTVAERMTALGLKWSPTTCADVENARRGVLVAEIIGLAVIFGTPIENLIRPAADVRVGRVVIPGMEFAGLIEGAHAIGFDPESGTLRRIVDIVVKDRLAAEDRVVIDAETGDVVIDPAAPRNDTAESR
jgi:transcriptional regulator with XRE-family HTH domain